MNACLRGSGSRQLRFHRGGKVASVRGPSRVRGCRRCRRAGARSCPSRRTQPGPPSGIKKLGTVNVREAAAAAKHAQYRPALRNLPAAKQFAALEERRNAEGAALRKPAPALQPPTVAGQRITSNEVQTGFEGLDIRDTVFSQGFEVEPPDQGLCGGTFGPTTFLWEEVNLAIGLFDTQQNQYTPPALGLNVLYGVPPAFDAGTGKFGPFLSDPKCYFDPDTGRWFHTVLEADVDPASGDLTGGANTLLAVSQTRDPLGPYTVYAIDASHAGCTLCIGDQPLLGADANGLYISTAEYDLAPPAGSPGFFGAQIYAIDKLRAGLRGHAQRRALRAGHAVHRHGAARDVAQRPLRDGTVRDGVLHVRPGLRAAGLPRRCGFAREHHPRVGSHPHRDPEVREPGPQALRPDGQEPGLRPAGPAAPEAGHPPARRVARRAGPARGVQRRADEPGRLRRRPTVGRRQHDRHARAARRHRLVLGRPARLVERRARETSASRATSPDATARRS